jgi:hypothetical protein
LTYIYSQQQNREIRLIVFIDEVLSLVTGDGVCNVGSTGSIADLANTAILICFAIRLLNKEINNASQTRDTHHGAETSIMKCAIMHSSRAEQVAPFFFGAMVRKA